MRSHSTRRSALIAVAGAGTAAGIVAVLMGLGAPGAAGRADWEVVSISGASQLNPQTNLFVGSGTITVAGEAAPVTWESAVLGTIGQDADGTLHLIGSHTFFCTAPGHRFEFTTFDTVTATPTVHPGVYTLTSHLKVEQGSGHFGTGQIVAAGGTLNFSTGTVTIPVALGKLARN